MASDLSATSRSALGAVATRVTMDSNIGDVTAITLPHWCRMLDISLKQSDDATADSGKFATSGTDSAAVGNNWFPIASGGTLTIPVGPASGPLSAAVTVYISAATASGFAHLLLRER